MGNAIEKQERKAPRSQKLAQAEEQRTFRKQNRHNVEEASWRDVSGDLLRNVIASVAGRGCAIQFGYTRDGGAFAIRIVGDGDPYNEYVRPSEDISYHLEGIVVDFTE